MAAQLEDPLSEFIEDILHGNYTKNNFYVTHEEYSLLSNFDGLIFESSQIHSELPYHCMWTDKFIEIVKIYDSIGTDDMTFSEFFNTVHNED